MIKHNDIKPQNILMNANGQIKLGDFGESYSFEEKSNAFRGSVAYSSPEKFFVISDDMEKDDVWSLGMIYGRFVFGEDFITMISSLDGSASLTEWNNFMLKCKDEIELMYTFDKLIDDNIFSNCIASEDGRENYNGLEKRLKSWIKRSTYNFDIEYLVKILKLAIDSLNDIKMPPNHSEIKFPDDPNSYTLSWKDAKFVHKRDGPLIEHFRFFHIPSKKFVFCESKFGQSESEIKFGKSEINNLKNLHSHPYLIAYYGWCKNMFVGRQFAACFETMDTDLYTVVKAVNNFFLKHRRYPAAIAQYKENIIGSVIILDIQGASA